MATVLPTPDRFAGLRGFSENLVSGLLQQAQQRKQLADQQLLVQQIQRAQAGGTPAFTGFQTPQGAAAAAQFVASQPTQLQQDLVRSQIQQNLGAAFKATQPEVITPTQQIAQRKLDRINLLEGKTADGTITVPETDELRRLRGGGAGVEVNLGNKTVDNLFKLRNEFNADPRVKSMRTANEFVNIIDSSFKRSLTAKNLGPIDVAMSKGFQKLTDIDSAVREGEFQLTFEGQSALNRLMGFGQRLVKGGLGLTTNERREIRDLSKVFLNEYRKSFNQAMQETRVVAESIGLDPKQINAIFGGREPFSTDREPVTSPDSARREALIDVGAEAGLPGFTTPQRSPRQDFTLEEIEAELRRRGQ